MHAEESKLILGFDGFVFDVSNSFSFSIDLSHIHHAKEYSIDVPFFRLLFSIDS